MKDIRLLFGQRFYNLFATDSQRLVNQGLLLINSEIKIPAFYDVSHWKIVTDWNNISPHPMLMGTKATQGTSYKDPTFPEYFTKFKDVVKCNRLAYHYFEKTLDPVKQANWFIDYIQPYINNDDILCLDFEQSGTTAKQLWAFINEVQRRCPYNLIIIYSRKNLMDPIIMTEGEKDFFRSIPVWVAGYPDNPNLYETTPQFYIPDQTKWGEVWSWQYTDSGNVISIVNDTDCNLIEQALIDYLNTIQGDEMTTYSGVTPTNIDTWNDPAGGKTGIIKAGTKIVGSAPTGTFTKLTDPSTYTKSSFLGSSWYKPETVVIPPPPVDIDDDIPYAITTVIDLAGYEKKTVITTGTVHKI